MLRQKRGKKAHFHKNMKRTIGPFQSISNFENLSEGRRREKMRVKKLTSHLWGKKPNDEDDDHPSILPFLNQLSKRKKSRNKRKRTFFKVGKETQRRNT
jgi:hypothetical protein